MSNLRTALLDELDAPGTITKARIRNLLIKNPEAGPRVVATAEELDALPVGTVVYAANHIGPAERFATGWMGCGNAAAWSSALLARDGLPAVIIHERAS
jgi:hypothetical protein